MEPPRIVTCQGEVTPQVQWQAAQARAAGGFQASVHDASEAHAPTPETAIGYPQVMKPPQGTTSTFDVGITIEASSVAEDQELPLN